jgi:protein-S-isoprenylcysteine O-methyltransferase Ste14
MFPSFLKSILHNIGVVLVGFGFAFIGAKLDVFLNITGFRSRVTTAAAWILVSLGFLLRVWATFHFYRQHLKVIALAPQERLITSGPFRFSRNPLYLGGNVFIFAGAALQRGSPCALLLTLLNIVLLDRWMIPREERQLERDFGEAWVSYTNKVRRWL